MKIFYCIVGMGFYGVVEDDVLSRDGLIISARRVFSIEAAPTQTIRSLKGDGVNFVISMYEDVTLNCAFISNMSKEAPFYQKILEILEKEKADEN